MKTNETRWWPGRCWGAMVMGGWMSVASLASAQGVDDLPFSSGSTGADGPLIVPALGPALSGPPVAFDPYRGELLTVLESGQLWRWNATNWVQILSATNPSPRTVPAMAYDEARRNLVLFGGTGAGGRETWIWDGTNWSLRTEASLTISNTPSARSGHAMVYDAVKQRVLLVGGSSGANETWAWDGLAWSFQGLLPVNPGTYPGLSFDRARGRAVLFGGDAGRRETWEWDGTNWLNRSEAIITEANTPAARYVHGMAYDSARGRTVLFGGTSGVADLWEWDGTNWLNRTPQPLSRFNSPLARTWPRMVHDPLRGEIVLVGGDSGPQETWLWNGARWRMWSGGVYYFDLSQRPNGLWNFTTIDVAANITVRFNRNPNNTPVRWLASGPVRIDGVLDLNGEAAPATTTSSGFALGGPGGYPGGKGALATNQSGSAVGSPGDGPGGGSPGVPASPNGQDGRHVSAYGNPYLQPLIGGSGGGGGASTAADHGGSGGGGGGAILISSSRDLTVNGQILANGGGASGGASAGGFGSGGAILLKGDRIAGTGILRAMSSGAPGTEGRIRLEAYYRQLSGSAVPLALSSLPVIDQSFTNNASLRIVSIDGVVVPPSPGGNATVPDVVFTSSNPVNIQVAALALPNNTPVRLRVTTSTGVVQATNVLSGTSATFTLPIPPGVGTVQAFAEYTLTN